MSRATKRYDSVFPQGLLPYGKGSGGVVAILGIPVGNLQKDLLGIMPFEEFLHDRFVLGSLDECYEQLRPYWEEVGCNHLIIRTD